MTKRIFFELLWDVSQVDPFHNTFVNLNFVTLNVFESIFSMEVEPLKKYYRIIYKIQ